MDHKFILNTFKMYLDVNKEPLNQHTKELLDMVDLGLNPIASEYNLKKEYSIIILGLSFKKNCSDTRNSKIFEVIKSLQKKNINIDYYDDMLVDEEIKKLNKSIKKVISLANLKKKYNVVIMNSSHDNFKKISNKIFNKITYKNSIFFDLSNFFSNEQKKKINRKFLFI